MLSLLNSFRVYRLLIIIKILERASLPKYFHILIKNLLKSFRGFKESLIQFLPQS